MDLFFNVLAASDVFRVFFTLSFVLAMIIVPIIVFRKSKQHFIIKSIYSVGAFAGVFIVMLVGVFILYGDEIAAAENVIEDTVNETDNKSEDETDTTEPPVVEKTAEQKILELGFEKFSDRYIWESEVNGTTIMFDTFFGVEKIVYEYESNRDGTLWSYYPNLNEGYIEGPTWDNYCMYNTESNTLVEGTECTQADIDLLLIMVGNYEETLEVIGTTKAELEALITELKN